MQSSLSTLDYQFLCYIGNSCFLACSTELFFSMYFIEVILWHQQRSDSVKVFSTSDFTQFTFEIAWSDTAILEFITVSCKDFYRIVLLSLFWIRCRVRWNQKFFWRKWAVSVWSPWTDPKSWMPSTWPWSSRSTPSSRCVESLLHANFNRGRCQGLDCVSCHLLQQCVTDCKWSPVSHLVWHCKGLHVFESGINLLINLFKTC